MLLFSYHHLRWFALIGIIVNKSFISSFKAFLSHKLTPLLANMDTDINMAALRERSLSHQGHNLREFSVFLTTSSVLYHKRIKYQNSNPS